MAGGFIKVACERAAYMAGVASGAWTVEDVGSMWTEQQRYEPQMSTDQAQSLMVGWERALERTRGWADPAAVRA